MTLEKLADVLIARGQTLSTAESCTGGGIAARCTDLPGSSLWFLGGVVTYANDMKVRLGVDPDALARNGAVSETVVRQMAEQARLYCRSDWCVAVSGVAGPDGGTPGKPVGTVWFAWASAQRTVAECCHFDGDRRQIREQSTDHGLEGLLNLLT